MHDVLHARMRICTHYTPAHLIGTGQHAVTLSIKQEELALNKFSIAWTNCTNDKKCLERPYSFPGMVCVRWTKRTDAIQKIIQYNQYPCLELVTLITLEATFNKDHAVKLAVFKEELHDYSNSVTGINTSELSVCIKHPDFSARRPIPDALKSYTFTWLSCMLLIANCPWLSFQMTSLTRAGNFPWLIS